MDQPYSAWADWLSKFHTWSELIQALWLVGVPLTLVGMTWIVMRGLARLASLLACRERGRLLYGIYEDAHGLYTVDRRNRCPPRIRPDSSQPESTSPVGLVDGTWRGPDS